MIFENSSFVTSLWISASKTVLGTLLSVLVTSTMAYAVSKVYAVSYTHLGVPVDLPVGQGAQRLRAFAREQRARFAHRPRVVLSLIHI